MVHFVGLVVFTFGFITSAKAYLEISFGDLKMFHKLELKYLGKSLQLQRTKGVLD